MRSDRTHALERAQFLARLTDPVTLAHSLQPSFEPRPHNRIIARGMRQETDSPTMRKRVADSYSADLYSRLAPGGPLLLVLTRWHEDDLAGRLLRDEPGEWDVIHMPVIADLTLTPDGGPLGRQDGDPLSHPKIPTRDRQPPARRRSPGYRGVAAQPDPTSPGCRRRRGSASWSTRPGEGGMLRGSSAGSCAAMGACTARTTEAR
ncbi:hypothetical protein [Streptomyces luteolus]|uniref:Uncharacterized protein n=1 Tax=Streptomyces luteolus TaxID=3043615 RepID=A0ABT6SYI5_9ACTN|nr:hypothetical protein [Streptomyces sp. B-S-A12]MDI3420664.1 hypothetical protein [Streptomyces sp. B-S-A12]